jgi:hypothetical protein
MYKNGDKVSMTDYRPVALLTTFSKIFEKIVYNRLSIIYILITYWFQNNLASGNGYPLKMLPSF